ncbi:hypothetical protein B0A52_06739 [Exophiala mesophila]|uniref:Uncharacterized protein n=1 Tax=Exophiala mesophila TaxID=212818 RepID=A0A438N1S0_EXOME|nr:hypothetical protein B0A52_06739 [Exophiala mesophila]
METNDPTTIEMETKDLTTGEAETTMIAAVEATMIAAAVGITTADSHLVEEDDSNTEGGSAYHLVDSDQEDVNYLLDMDLSDSDESEN